MPKQTLALLLVTFAVVSLPLPRNCGATNYHEYKKFDPPSSTEKVPSRCHANPRERRNYYYCDRWRDFLHHD